MASYSYSDASAYVNDEGDVVGVSKGRNEDGDSSASMVSTLSCFRWICLTQMILEKLIVTKSKYKLSIVYHVYHLITVP